MITEIELTRAALTAADPLEAVRPLSDLVASATTTGSVAFASNGHLRSIEFWIRGDEVVLLGVAPSDPPRSGSLMSGGDAVTGWLELVMPAAGWSAGGTAVSIPGVDVEIDRIVTGADGSTAVLVVETSGERRALLRVDGDGGTRWARVDGGKQATLDEFGAAAYVGQVLELGPERLGSAIPTPA